MKGDSAVLRRTWPQRIVILACLGLIAAAVGSAYVVEDFYSEVADIGRIEFAGDLLDTETSPGEPVNFLIIGEDSADGIDPDDPVTIGREIDPRGRYNADSIAILRVDPVGGQAWALSIPRDLQVEMPGRGERKINSASVVEGPELLVRVIEDTFDIGINHYVQLDFLAFRDVVEELGGVPMWFHHPSRDLETGFNALGAGCTNLDGTNALAFVRSRRYEEFIGDGWVKDPTADFGRIERQQQFVVAALDRAIARGARNPTTLAALIDSAAASVTLDQGLTAAELIELAEAFTNFDSESLQTFSPAVVDLFDDEGRWKALGLVEDLDSEMFEIFRGGADAVSREEIRFVVAGVDPAAVVDATELLRDLGFAVGPERVVADAGAASVIVHPVGERTNAEELARYVVPVPAVVEDSSTTEMTLVLGAGYSGISFFYPQPLDETLDAIDDLGEVPIPPLSTVTSTSSSVAASPQAAEDEDVAFASPTSPPTTAPLLMTAAAAPTTTAPLLMTAAAAPTTTAPPLPGRPPEGQTCG